MYETRHRIVINLSNSSIEVNWQRVIFGLKRGWVFVEGFLKPDFTSRKDDILIGFQESVTMAITSTFVGVFFGGRMMPPNWGYVHELWWPIWETVNIATLGTLIGIVLALPIAFLAARNTTPSTRIIRPVALFIIVASRSINSLIWALLLVAILGPGLLAGIIAIALRSIGFIGKLLYEAIEEIDVDQVEAIEATGASTAQVMT